MENIKEINVNYNYIAWINKIKEIKFKGMKNVEINFPIINNYWIA